MAHTKAKGTTKLGRDSESKRLGVKIYGGEKIKCGQIIIRQRGTRYMAGENVKTGKDDTLYAVTDGTVLFKKIRYTNFTGNKQMKQFVSVSKDAETKATGLRSQDLGKDEKKTKALKVAVKKANPTTSPA